MCLENNGLYVILRCGALSKNALTLMQFVEATKLPINEVSMLLKFLVLIQIFKSNCSGIGDMVYVLAENNEAQEVASLSG